MSYDIFTGLLKMNNEFDNGDNIILDYDFNHQSLRIIKEKYNIEYIAGDGDELSKTLNVLHWVSAHIMHSGNSKAKESDIIYLMDYSFDKGTDCGINCAMLSHVLAGCLMSIGIYAREVKLIPYSPYDYDSHRVVHAYISQLRKWIMLDPSYSAYVMDNEGIYLNILDIRQKLAEREEIFFNKEINYNGQCWETDSQFYREYLAKNTFCLCTPALMTFNEIKFDGFVYVCPQHFDIKQRDIYCMEYKNAGSYIDVVRNDRYLRIAKETLINTPK